MLGIVHTSWYEAFKWSSLGATATCCCHDVVSPSVMIDLLRTAVETTSSVAQREHMASALGRSLISNPMSGFGALNVDMYLATRNLSFSCLSEILWAGRS